MISQQWIKLPAVLLAACLSLAPATAQVLTSLKQCKLVATEWSDGDSFQIQTFEGQTHTIRLYGADCIEWHVSDDSDARRLRAQRRYFGISEWGGSPKASIQAAKELGEAAAKEVASALKRPFLVHTAFADARGDGKYKRIYAFVTTAEGEDLAERLVRLGLARAFGVYRETPTGKNSNDYREYLQDVELQAAKRGVGAWAKTNWDLLPNCLVKWRARGFWFLSSLRLGTHIAIVLREKTAPLNRRPCSGNRWRTRQWCGSHPQSPLRFSSTRPVRSPAWPAL